MNTKFSLIEKLNQRKSKENKRDPFPSTIEYQEYILDVNGVEKTIFIPIKECPLFEKSLTNETFLDEDGLRIILRKHRGIRKS